MSVLVEAINRETERLDQLMKRRIAAYDRALRLQIQAALEALTEDAQAPVDLYSPSKLLLANSKAVQKEVQANLEKFRSLVKYQEKL